MKLRSFQPTVSWCWRATMHLVDRESVCVNNSSGAPLMQCREKEKEGETNHLSLIERWWWWWHRGVVFERCLLWNNIVFPVNATISDLFLYHLDIDDRWLQLLRYIRLIWIYLDCLIMFVNVLHSSNWNYLKVSLCSDRQDAKENYIAHLSVLSLYRFLSPDLGTLVIYNDSFYVSIPLALSLAAIYDSVSFIAISFVHS
jgi:hypothetical protein